MFNDEEQTQETKALPSSVRSETDIPTSDSLDRSLWVRTRMCFCEPQAPTDCRFHGQDEKGWATCPNLEIAKKDRTKTGRWLWARNPLFGKPKTEAENVVVPEVEKLAA